MAEQKAKSKKAGKNEVKAKAYLSGGRKLRNQQRKAETRARRLQRAMERRVEKIRMGDKPKRLPHPDPVKAAEGKTIKGKRPSEVLERINYKREARRENRRQSPARRRARSEEGERQFLGRNPRHNALHGRPMPQAGIEVGAKE